MKPSKVTFRVDQTENKWYARGNSARNPDVIPMPYPPNKAIELPLLKEIADAGGEVSIRNGEIYRRVASYFPQITDEELIRPHSSKDTTWENRVQWVRQRLVEKAELAHWRAVGRQGIWRITEKGRLRLEKERDQLDMLVQQANKPFTSDVALTPEERQQQQHIHQEVQDKLIDIGHILRKFAKGEYREAMYRYDVVWKDSEALPRASHCFEVQHKGNVVEALAKLKHAHDLWRARLFLVVTDERDKVKASQLLVPYFSGTFHEIGSVTTVMTAEDVYDLHSVIDRHREIATLLFGA
ncbi:MAG: winged helix-turn-helix domain-containing protein [Chloroflexi bacterium]|nr:winged helix-turn-helix domain-containing protein [Chloroflexota bacterium]